MGVFFFLHRSQGVYYFIQLQGLALSKALMYWVDWLSLTETLTATTFCNSALLLLNLIHVFTSEMPLEWTSYWVKVVHNTKPHWLLSILPSNSFILPHKCSPVSLHLCLKSTLLLGIGVPLSNMWAHCQLLSLLHKWNKSQLCKKWCGHGKGWYYFSIRSWSKYQEACKSWYVWTIRTLFSKNGG